MPSDIYYKISASPRWTNLLENLQGQTIRIYNANEGLRDGEIISVKDDKTSHHCSLGLIAEVKYSDGKTDQVELWFFDARFSKSSPVNERQHKLFQPRRMENGETNHVISSEKIEEWLQYHDC